MQHHSRQHEEKLLSAFLFDFPCTFNDLFQCNFQRVSEKTLEVFRHTFHHRGPLSKLEARVHIITRPECQTNYCCSNVQHIWKFFSETGAASTSPAIDFSNSSLLFGESTGVNSSAEFQRVKSNSGRLTMPRRESWVSVSLSPCLETAAGGSSCNMCWDFFAATPSMRASTTRRKKAETCWESSAVEATSKPPSVNAKPTGVPRTVETASPDSEMGSLC